ncbi:hypothetical protein BAUCODRAFT_32104 [Baudoinia panamericana UAMH 10762]|uniref:Methyltransferase domain-containing protein n=1 Tax=Baudoinia panamericana (strain UAMH 10762) TaxID=717646 RepID=M2N2F5_BAUPA|nr:uncharacterized protein BAUCODRAFT_32104 [Baudoinia panamericana UAMH 10762]EMC98103.1 hypothetical protein BAUCODRAFT_32104 [Baudoinia panamericana UAMH 10762]
MTDIPQDAPWYTSDIDSIIQPQSRRMLQEYAGIASDRIVEHIKVHREIAWSISPYPSVGALTWVNPYMLLHEAHKTILRRVKAGGTIVDCGCMISPDLRLLAWEGAPTNRMFAFDIEPTFFDLGFDFYNDRDKWQGHFIDADGTKPIDETPLKDLKHAVDIVWCPKFLHLFDRQGQIDNATRLIEMLKPQPGSIFAGSQNGLPETQDVTYANSRMGTGYRTIWMANAKAVEEMWNEVARKTNTTWDVQARLLDLRTIGMHEDDGSEYKRKTGYNLQWTAVWQ